MTVTLFEQQLHALENYLAQQERAGKVQQLSLEDGVGWPQQHRLVLQADTILDLGNPSVGSLAFLLWSNTTKLPSHDRLFLLGPEMAQLASNDGSCTIVPFGQVVVVRGPIPDDYEGYLTIREALYDIAPEGLTLRSLPSQGYLWCRLHRDSLARGFSFAHLGAALVERLHQIGWVHQIDIFFHTLGREALEPLQTIAYEVAQKVGAFIKRNEEENPECDACEYSEICDEKEHKP